MAEARSALPHVLACDTHPLIDRVGRKLDHRLSQAAAYRAVRPQIMRMHACCRLTCRCIGWEARACDDPAWKRRVLALVSNFILVAFSPVPPGCHRTHGGFTPVIRTHGLDRDLDHSAAWDWLHFHRCSASKGLIATSGPQAVGNQIGIEY